MRIGGECYEDVKNVMCSAQCVMFSNFIFAVGFGTFGGGYSVSVEKTETDKDKEAG